MEENQEQLAFDPNNIRSSHFKIRSSSNNRRQLKRISNPQKDKTEEHTSNQTQEDNQQQPNENGVSPIKTVQSYRYKNYGGTAQNPSPIRPYNPPSSKENNSNQKNENIQEEEDDEQQNEMNIQDQNEQKNNHFRSQEDYNNNIEEIVDTLNTEVLDENEQQQQDGESENQKHNNSISPQKLDENESGLQIVFKPKNKKINNLQPVNSETENPEQQQQEDPIKQYKMSEQQKQYYSNLQKTKEIWCTIKSLGSIQVNYDKAISFLKRILKLESELDQVNAAIYTQPQNCKLYDQKQQKNEHTFYLQMSNIEVKDYEYLLSFTYVSQKTGSNIVFSETKPSTFVLNPVGSDIKEQDEEQEQQDEQSRPQAFQLGEKKSNQVFNVEEQLPYEPNQFHFMSSEKFEGNSHIIHELLKLCCGFMNKDHFQDEKIAGKIYIGTSDQGHIEGVKYDDQKKQFKAQFLQAISETMQTPYKELIDVNVCDIMEQYRLNRENLVIIEIVIQKPETSNFASVKFKENHRYYQRIKNKNPELLTSQLCMYVEDRISKMDLKRQIEFLEKHGGSSSPLRSENSPKMKPKGMRSSSHHDNVFGQAKILGRHQKLNNNQLPNFQGTQSSSPEKKPKATAMTEKRDKRSITADNQTNSKQHNIFKQSYNKQPLMMGNNQKYAFPKAKNNSLLGGGQDQESTTIPNTMRQSAHFQQEQNNSGFHSIRENQSTLPPAFSGNTEKIDKNKLKADAFLLNNNATLTQRENMLNNIGSKGNIFQQNSTNENNMNAGNFRNTRKLADLPVKAKNNIFNNNNLLNNNRMASKNNNEESNPLSQYNIQPLDKQSLGGNKPKLI